jgi:hypothetical protein
MQEPFYVRCEEGLGNKIKCLLSALRLSSHPAIVWTKNLHFNDEFSDLFMNDWCIDHIPDGADAFRTWQFLVLPDDPEVDPNRTLSCLHFPTATQKGRFVDGLYDKMPTAIRDIYVEKIRLLKLHPEVEAVSRKAMERMAPNSVSVHIRSWYDDRKRRWTFCFNEYRRAIEKFPEASFFLCSDSSVVTKMVKKAFPGRVYTLHDLVPEAAKMQRGQIDLIEMIVLGNTNNMIVTEGSTFTEISWLFGGGKAKVITVSPPEFWKKVYVALTYLSKTFKRPVWLQRLMRKRTKR